MKGDPCVIYDLTVNVSYLVDLMAKASYRRPLDYAEPHDTKG